MLQSINAVGFHLSNGITCQGRRLILHLDTDPVHKPCLLGRYEICANRCSRNAAVRRSICNVDCTICSLTSTIYNYVFHSRINVHIYIHRVKSPNSS